MRISASQLLVCEPCRTATMREFVEFWGCRYFDANDAKIYERYVRGPHTAESLHKLFRWKFGHFQESKRARGEVSQHFINHRKKAAALVRALSSRPRRDFAAEFLREFDGGGAIRRIFWLHCWNNDFPLYDQHVHRAMTHILNKGKTEELAKAKEEEKIDHYLDRYLSFFDAFPAYGNRLVDKALWQFGKSLTTGAVPKPRPGWSANGCSASWLAGGAADSD